MANGNKALELWKYFIPVMVLKEKMNQICYYETGPRFSPISFGSHLNRLIEEVRRTEEKEKILFLCIGSDRSTGDSLGPLIGYKLEQNPQPDRRVIGTLSRPVHAVNLADTVEEIQKQYSNHVVIAIDASIGLREQVGTISLGKGAIQPGLGVSKKLSKVGDIFITGVVGSGRCLEPNVLQSIRLSMVMDLADTICMGIYSSGVEMFSVAGDRV